MSKSKTPKNKEFSRRKFLAMGVGAGTSVLLLNEACTTPENTQEKTTESVANTEIRKESVLEKNTENKPEISLESSQEKALEPSTELLPENKETSAEPSIEEFNDDGSVPEITELEQSVESNSQPDTLTAFDPYNSNESKKIFAYGLSSGGMTASTAVLWTYFDGNQPKQLKVWRQTVRLGQVMMDVDKQVVADSNGYCKVKVSGLQSESTYFFAFFSGQERSPIGRFKTAFATGIKKSLLIGASTCTNSIYKPYESLELLAKEDLDLFLHLGDMTYNDSANSLKTYRKEWKETLEDPGYLAILQKTGMYITWDDHEFTNNLNPETANKSQMAYAKQTYFEALPVEKDSKDRIWRSYKWGDTAEIFLLDARSERKPSTRNSNNPVYLGDEQMKWFKDAIQKSTAHFKLIMNSVPMTNMPSVWLSQNDRWEGYDKQRTEVLDHLVNNNIKNVWFISGDFHVGFVSKLEESGKYSHMREIAVGPGASLLNPLVTGIKSKLLPEESVFPKKQFEYYGDSNSATTTFLLDPIADTIRIKFVDAKSKNVLFDQTLKQS